MRVYQKRSKAGTNGVRAQRLCLRQNQISTISFPDSLGPVLHELDLYDNLIGHIKGLEELKNLTSLDLSFNKIKHIKNVNHLTKLKDLYFVQNKIQKIEGLEGLPGLRQVELAANRIRVSAMVHRFFPRLTWTIGDRKSRNADKLGGALAW